MKSRIGWRVEDALDAFWRSFRAPILKSRVIQMFHIGTFFVAALRQAIKLTLLSESSNTLSFSSLFLLRQGRIKMVARRETSGMKSRIGWHVEDALDAFWCSFRAPILKSRVIQMFHIWLPSSSPLRGTSLFQMSGFR
jgi:uncharacterized membrane protein